MMTEYIDRKQTIDRFEDYKEKADSLKDKVYLDAVMAVLENIPKADVEQVIHGKWESDGSSVHYCSECGVDVNLVACERWKYKRCPLCGAIMDFEVINNG